MPVSSRLVKITPVMAQKWLEGNVLNRTIKDRIVKYYADQMKRNMWLQNGSTLVFAADGTLLDGQHRLWACIESNTPFVTLVAEGVDKSSFPTIDTGAGRSTADVINISGHKHFSSMIASAATHILNYKTGDLNAFKKRVVRMDVLNFVNENDALIELTTLARCTKSPFKKHAAVVIAICFMAGKKHPQPVRNFLSKFLTGEDLSAKNPILVLRNRFSQGDRLLPYERLALVAHAWNAYVTGKQLTHLKLVAGTGLPKIIGA